MFHPGPGNGDGKGGFQSPKMTSKDRLYLDKLAANVDLFNAEVVVKDATNPRSLLHKYFLWDNTKAAHLYRLVSARQLIRDVRVVHRTMTRAYHVPVYVRDVRTLGYVRVKVVKGRQDRDVLLARELRAAFGHFTRVAGIAASFKHRLLKDVEAIYGKMETLLEKLKA